MIICKNATFMHVPKCGGTYIRAMLKSHWLSHEECALPVKTDMNPKIGFIRNPFSWHVSWFNFKNSGSDIYKSNDIYKMCNKGDVSFETYLNNLSNPTEEFKLKYHSVLQSFSVTPALYQMAYKWIESDKSYYEHIYDSILHNSQIYKLETMKQDLPNILDDVGMLTDDVKEKLMTSPHINIGKVVDYRDYYTPTLEKLVLDSHQRILTMYDYSL